MNKWQWISVILLCTMATVFAEKEVKMIKDGKNVNIETLIHHFDPYAELELTADQDKKFEMIKLEFEMKALPWKQKIEAKELEFKAEMLKDNPAKQTLNTIIDEVFQYRAEIKKNEIAQKYALREILNKDQQVIWDKGPGNISLGYAVGFDHDVQKKMVWITDEAEMDIDAHEGEKEIEIKHKVMK